MPEPLQIPSEPGVVDELHCVLNRARQGDESVLPQLRRILDTRPELWQYYGDMALHALRAWIDLIAGTDLLLKESVTLKAHEMRSELAGPNPSPLELLLAERAVACWLQLCHADAKAAESMSNGSPTQIVDFWSKRQKSANSRYITSLGALATLRRLLPRAETRGLDQPQKRKSRSKGTEIPYAPALRLVDRSAKSD